MRDTNSWSKETQKKNPRDGDVGTIAGAPASMSMPIHEALAAKPDNVIERTVRRRKPAGGYYRSDTDDLESWSAARDTKRWKARSDLGLAGKNVKPTPIDLKRNDDPHKVDERTTNLRIRNPNGTGYICSFSYKLTPFHHRRILPTRYH
jgi:hypothetical protein